LSAWPLRRFRRAHQVAPVDPIEEEAAAQRLLPTAREVLVALGAAGAAEMLQLVGQLAPHARTEILCAAGVDVQLVADLLARGCTVYDAAAAPNRTVLVLDRRLGWRLPPWEPLAHAFQTAYRLLWTRLGYYTFIEGTVDAVHPENRMFSLAGRRHWINAAYSDLPLPAVGEHLRVLGMFSYLGSTVPLLHALRIEAAPAAD
jgi:hypothetical protein